MVPLLVLFARMDQRTASATSLAAIVPTAIVGSLTYLAHGQVDFVAGGFIAIGAIAGALLGSLLLERLPLVWLRWAFIVFLLLIAIRMFLVSPVRGENLGISPVLIGGYIALGLVMGFASGLFGIGGGAIAVPALIGIFALSDLIAKGTSLLVMIPTSVVGTVANWRAKTVDVVAGLVVGVLATVGSIPGTLLALALSPRLSAILFGALLLVIATDLAVRAVRQGRAGTA